MKQDQAAGWPQETGCASSSTCPGRSAIPGRPREGWRRVGQECPTYALRLLAGLLWLATSASGANVLRVGADQAGGNVFTGTIGAARAYDRALTDAEVAALAAARPAETAVAGALPDLAADPEGDYSLVAWVRADKNAALQGRVLDRITPGGTDGVLLDFNAGQLRAISGDVTVTGRVPSKAGAWMHVGAVCVAGAPVLFVDGKPVTSRAPRTDAAVSPSTAPAPAEATTLWWNKPANGWTAAAPLGNGRLGVMAEGGVEKEVLWLNDDTLWSGEPAPSPDTAAVQALPDVRRLLFERKESEAHALFQQKMFGPWNECYMPLGTLEIAFPAAARTEDYRRTLDLMTGVFTVSYRRDGVTYTREIFVSHPDQAVVVRIRADRPGKVSLSAGLASQLR